MSRDLSHLGPEIDSRPAAHPNTSTPIKGKHVTLEKLTQAHIPSLWKNLALHSNPQLLDFLPWRFPSNEEEWWSTLNSFVQDRKFILSAVNVDPNHVNPSPNTPAELQHSETVGIIGYLDIDVNHRTLETGGVLFGPILARSYAATEAHYLILKGALEKGSPVLSNNPDAPPYRRVSWKCNHINLKSRRAAERLGYVFEGTWRNHWVVKGRTRDSDWLSVIDRDWPVVKMALEQWLDPSNFDSNGQQIRHIDEIRAAIISRS